MGVLFLGHAIYGSSHVWMRRMLEGLGDSVAILATDAESSRIYGGRFRAISKPSPPPVWRRAAHRLRLTAESPWDESFWPGLRRGVESPEVSVILVHYLYRAVPYESIWRGTSKPVWVHCHGADVTWDMRSVEAPEDPRHSDGYVRRVIALPDNVRFIANSYATEGRLRAIGIASERIRVKYLGVEVPKAPPLVKSNGRRVCILYLGRFVDFKGPDLVLRAFERGSSPELCVKVRGSSSMLRLGCLGDLLGLEE